MTPRILTEHPFPDDLEGRMNAVLNAVNTELKSAILLALSDHAKESGEIRQSVREIAGPRVYLPQVRTFEDYCRRTLVPVGFVAREEVLREDGDVEHLGYGITQAGKTYGQPIAAFTIEWTAKHKKSMYSIMGFTGSNNDSRSPQNRMQILNTLYDKGRAIQEVELEEIRGLKGLSRRPLGEHMLALQEVGLISFESVGANREGFARFAWAGKDVAGIQSVGSYHDLTRRVAESLANLGEADYLEIAGRIGHRNKNEVSTILNGLEKQGAASVVKWGGWKRSQISLLEPGRQFVEGWLRVIESALNDDVTTRSDLDRRYIDWKQSPYMREQLGYALELYREISPFINKKPKNEQLLSIAEYIIQNPGARIRDISDNMRIHRASASKYVHRLVKDDLIRIEIDAQDKQTLRYYPQ